MSFEWNFTRDGAVGMGALYNLSTVITVYLWEFRCLFCKNVFVFIQQESDHLRVTTGSVISRLPNLFSKTKIWYWITD